MVSKIEIHLLGPPRVTASGRILPIRRRKALALIAFLASSRAPHTRELLAGTFWPEADPESAHAQIRNHLWVLRTAGLGPWLCCEGEMVALREAGDLRVDVREHRRLLASAGLSPGRTSTVVPQAESILTEAVAIYQAPFLAGFSLADSPSFDEWQLVETDRLRAGMEAALDALTRLREERGDLEGAVESASRRLELDPLDERTLRHVMHLHARVGRPGQSLMCYERAARLLKRELELPPSRETVLLRDRIVAGGAQKVTIEACAAPAPSALPQPTTPFVGRDAEILEIMRQVDEPGLRLLTLTGPGGCGKTRLALEAGRNLGGRYPDGVFFASLASIEAGSLLPSTIAEALSLPLGSHGRAGSPAGRAGRSARPVGSAALQELIGVLREKRLLIILDNLEQLSSELESLRAILAGTRDPVFLATSRTRLRLPGERVLDVEGLPWPQRHVPVGELAGYASVRLFVQSVRRTRARFQPAAADLSAAAEISRRLRGHPLGIELAASWAYCLSTREIAEQTASGTKLEAAPGADVAPRHRSLRAVFEQSWSLLSSEEKAALRRLSWEPGSFDRAAALEIGKTRPEVLAALVEQSFLRHNGNRFEILETLRQFGRQKLAENSREESAVFDRAARHYLLQVTAARSSLEGPGQRRTLKQLTRDRHHLRQAWLHAAERGWIREMSKAVRPLFLYYDMCSRVVEGAEVFGVQGARLDRLRKRLEPGTAGTRELRLAAVSRVAQAWFLRFDDVRRARRWMLQGQHQLTRLGEPAERAFADALAAVIHPRSAAAERTLREDALQCETAGDLWCAGLCWEILAYSLAATDAREGFHAIHRSLSLRRRCRDQWSIALGLLVLGLGLEHRGLLRGARRHYEESLALRRRLGVDQDGVFSCLEAITRVALLSGAVDDARRHGEEALAVAKRSGHHERVAQAQTRLAQAHILAGRPDEARPLLGAALVSAEELRRAGWSSHLHALGGLASFEAGENEEALLHLERARSVAPADPAGEDDDGRWPAFWRLLLEARLALAQGDLAAARGAALDALEQAHRARHEPVLSQVLAVWTASSERELPSSTAGAGPSALVAELAAEVLAAERGVD